MPRVSAWNQGNTSGMIDRQDAEREAKRLFQTKKSQRDYINGWLAADAKRVK